MKLHISYMDGTYDVEITPGVEVAFERQFKGGFGKLLRTEERAEHGYWLAWECLRRSGVTVPPFGDKFLDGLTAVDVVDEHPNG